MKKIWDTKNTHWKLLFAGSQSIATGFAGQFLLLMSGPILARILGVEGRGHLAGLCLWPLMIIGLGNLGIPSAATYYLNRYPSLSSNIIGETFKIATLQALILTPVAASILLFWTRDKSPELRFLVYPLLLLVPMNLVHNCALAVLQGGHRFKIFNLVRTLPAAFNTLGLCILFFTGGAGLLPVVIVYVASSILAASLAVIFSLRGQPLHWAGIPDLRRAFFSFALRGHLGRTSPLNDLRLDQIVIALLLSPQMLGLYVVASAFSNLPRFVAQSAGYVIYPSVAARSNTEARLLIWRSFLALIILTSLIIGMLIAILPLIITLFFGPSFIEAAPIGRLLLIGAGLSSMRMVLVEGLRGAARPGISTISELSIYPCLLLLVPALLSNYGVNGLATALTVSQGVSLAVAIGGAYCYNLAPQFVNTRPRLQVAAPRN